MKKHTEFTKKEFEELPFYEDVKDLFKAQGMPEAPFVFDSLVILPSSEKHQSGYRKMFFVIIKDCVPLGRVGGRQDLIFGKISPVTISESGNNGRIPFMLK